MVQFSMLLAIEVILGVTPLGLIMVPPVAITIMHIPVIICGVVMGPLMGGLLGGVFGLISMIKATTQGLPPIDILFSPVHSGAPVASVVMCMLPRILLGVLAGLVFRLVVKASKKAPLAAGVSAVLCTVLHTLMVLGSLFLFFDAIPLKSVFGTIITLNGGLEIIAAALVAIPVSAALLKFSGQTFEKAPPAPENSPE